MLRNAIRPHRCRSASGPIVLYWGQKSAASMCQCQQSKGRGLDKVERKQNLEEVETRGQQSEESEGKTD